MKRSELIKNKIIQKKIYFYIFLIFFIIIFIFTIGFNILINLSIFISNITKNNRETINTNLVDNDNFYGKIYIDNFPTATNSGEFIITGSVINFDILEIYLNDKKLKTINIGKSSSFSETISDLKLGNNNFYLKGKTNDNKYQQKTRVYSIFYKNEKPKLEIIEPNDGFITNNYEVTIKGKTDKEVFVKINNSPIVVDSQGNFQSIIKLNEGENQITIKATDIAGNFEEKIIKVFYQKDY